MKLIFVMLMVVSLALTFNQKMSAQENQSVSNLFYGELGGPGIIMSFNFDGRFKSNTNLGLGYRFGVGFGIGDYTKKESEIKPDEGLQVETYTEGKRTVYSFPVGLNYILGKPNKASSFEVGGGVSFLTHKSSFYNYDFDNEKKGYILGYATFMYRLMPLDGGFSLRLGLTPIIGTAGYMYPMGAFSIGYAF